MKGQPSHLPGLIKVETEIKREETCPNPKRVGVETGFGSHSLQFHIHYSRLICHPRPESASQKWSVLGASRHLGEAVSVTLESPPFILFTPLIQLVSGLIGFTNSSQI